MMETTEIKPINHPYMKVLQATLDTQKKMLECLEKRLVFIRTDFANKNDYEKNEIEILEIKTLDEIDVRKRVILEKENYFIRFMEQFVKDAEELERNYDNVVESAKKLAHKNKNIADILNKVKWEVLDTDMEVKIHFYKRLKGFLNK